ncbi:hypothetical protein MKW92_049878 [Papaver armeniacum]|nr:hypothetical protein MKW92_049878 [Papaver armeniacum]
MGIQKGYPICITPGIVGSDKGGLFYAHSENFKSFGALPSICLQICILSFVPYLMHMALSRFHQPLIVSQILGGILVSPWVLGSRWLKGSPDGNVGISDYIFPLDGFQVVDILAHFSSMFFIFKVGVQMDPKILKRAGRQPYIIGFFCIACSYVVGLQISHTLQDDDIPGLNRFIRMISFPVIAYVLDDLKILSSDLGNSAIHIAMVADFLHLGLKFFSFCRQIFRNASQTYAVPAVLLLLAIGTVIYIFFIVRPAALWIVKNTPEGRPVDDIYITWIMISVLLCGLASEYCGLNGTVGVFLLGLAIPDGPPLGSALVKKLRIVSVFFMPLHMGIVGYKTDIRKVSFVYLWRILLIILGCILGKIIGLFIPAVLLGVSPLDSFLLGLIMNIKGIVEVFQLNTWLDSLNTKEIFTASNTIMVLALVMLVAVITPAVKYLYDPSSKYLTYKGRSILQSNEKNSDFRVLVCVHTIDDVPAIMRIIEASNPTKLHPLTIYLLHLVELVGRASPLLISHTSDERASTSNPTKSQRIINVFKQFQNRYQNLVTVHPFTTVSPYASMHNDICTMSVDKRAALVIFPFCRQDASIMGDLARPDISNRAMKTLLQNLLRNTPCSVGILMDGGNLQTKSTCFSPDTPYRVVVLLFGGPDDREALAFAMNMIHHPYVFVTLVRFFGPASLSSNRVINYDNDSVSIDIGRNMFLDDELVDHFRVNTMHDETLIYKEVEVKDGAETIWAVRSLHQDFDLMLVGRQQKVADSKIISGLDANWDECGELGSIGELVTSPDYGAEGSILIIHRRRDIT